ncbi:MAG: GNAT family N-acetyltransferase [Gemmatimonadota bacterium]|nr:GNAT family N-acetyltransferase [Gemmatimonadota bacterium]
MRQTERSRWSARHNPSLGSRWVERFIARQDRSIVGRIAAVVDSDFATRWEPHSGFFGFFESVDDTRVASALLETAESALRTQGRTGVFGPVNLTMHDEVGLLVEGFESRSMLLSPYNPPWYEGLLTDAGYACWTDYQSFSWDLERSTSPAAQRIVQRLARGTAPGGVRLRHSDPRHWIDEGRTLLDVYNRSFADVWGFVPLSWHEYLSRASQFRKFYRPELAVFAEVDGRMVGFALALPDVNEALATIGGRLWPFGWLRLARAIPRIQSARFILLGVLPEFAGRGIAVLLAHRTAMAARDLGIERAELSLVQVTNERIRRVIDAFGGRPLKTYRLFHKAL